MVVEEKHIDWSLHENTVNETVEEIKIFIAKKFAEMIAEMAVEYVMNKIRAEEPYLIYTEQERL